MTVQARFVSHPASGLDWSLNLARPERVLQARSLDEVAPVLDALEAQALAGRWVALMIAYEAAPALDDALTTHSAGDFPLAWGAVFNEPQPSDPAPGKTLDPNDWRPLVSRNQYLSNLDAIRAYIRQGESYQVNYTLPFECIQPPHGLDWFSSLLPAQQAGLAAYLDMGRFQVLSFSPELFFHRRGLLRTRPMKGTMPRGRWPEEDDARARQLAACPKNRAENVMIVDLLRNDLGKIAVPGGVRVPELFRVERYPTVLQMTSSVEAELREGVVFVDILRALFPCGSVTGAPKARTMQIIRELEPFPRQAYCGAVGLLKPGGEAILNVPIRTIVADRERRRARFGVGGGITWGSSPVEEWEECVTKMAFLDRPDEEFELLESLLLRDGAYVFLQKHLDRMRTSAGYFGFAFREPAALQALEHLRTQHSAGRHKVRLLASADGSVRVEAAPLLDDPPEPVRLGLASEPVDSQDAFLFHKTTRREVYDRARASRPECDDVVLANERGEVTESSFANLVALIDGELLTPARVCGLLNGTFRSVLLKSGLARESRLSLDDLRGASLLWLINSVRGWRQAVLAEEEFD
ncbi:MAG: aminodeoxychorismate synthase component I [Desulfovibrionaceae bacterium]